jgi:hypothetical protein
MKLPTGRLVRDSIFTHQFDGDNTLERGIPSSVDDAHAAYGDQLLKLVTPKGSALKWHLRARHLGQMLDCPPGQVNEIRHLEAINGKAWCLLFIAVLKCAWVPLPQLDAWNPSSRRE